MEIKVIIKYCFYLLMLSSCAVAEMEIAHEPSVHKQRIAKTKSDMGFMSREDSLRMVYEIQTNREGFLVRHIGQENGEWTIRISRENALTLGISAETYDFYQEYVNRLNK